MRVPEEVNGLPRPSHETYRWVRIALGPGSRAENSENISCPNYGRPSLYCCIEESQMSGWWRIVHCSEDVRRQYDE